MARYESNRERLCLCESRTQHGVCEILIRKVFKFFNLYKQYLIFNIPNLKNILINFIFNDNKRVVSNFTIFYNIHNNYMHKILLQILILYTYHVE